MIIGLLYYGFKIKKLHKYNKSG